MRPANIMIIEDNKSDVDLIIYYLKKHQIKNQLQVIYDGESAIRFSNSSEDNRDFIKPDVIFLDMNLPRVHGLEILKQFRSNPTYKATPIIVVSQMMAKSDILNAMSSGASYFIEKPITYESLLAAIGSIDTIFISLVTSDD